MGKRDQLFEECLNRLAAGESLVDVLALYPEQAEEIRPPMEAFLWLRRKRQLLQPRAGFILASCRRLVAQVKKEGFPENSRLAWWNWLLLPLIHLTRTQTVAARWALTIVLVASLLFSGAGAAYAAQNTLPGDQLYFLKIGLEETRLALTVNEQAKTHLEITYLQKRLNEIQSLALEGRYDWMDEAVNRYERDVQRALKAVAAIAGRDPQVGKSLAGFLSETIEQQAAIMAAIQKSIPAPIQTEFERARVVSAMAMQQAAAVISQIENTDGENLAPLLSPNTSTPTSTPTPLIAQATPSAGAVISLSPTATIPPTGTALPFNASDPSYTPTSSSTPNPHYTPRPGSTSLPSNTPAATNTARPTHTALPSSTPKPPHPPQPSDTPRPSNTPQPSNTPKPSSTPEPSDTPRPSDTPQPSATPRPTSTPGPTNTPRPPRTQPPTASPLPTSTPRPTFTPVPTSTPRPRPIPTIIPWPTNRPTHIPYP